MSTKAREPEQPRKASVGTRLSAMLLDAHQAAHRAGSARHQRSPGTGAGTPPSRSAAEPHSPHRCRSQGLRPALRAPCRSAGDGEGMAGRWGLQQAQLAVLRWRRETTLAAARTAHRCSPAVQRLGPESPPSKDTQLQPLAKAASEGVEGELSCPATSQATAASPRLQARLRQPSWPSSPCLPVGSASAGQSWTCWAIGAAESGCASVRAEGR